MGEVHTSGSGVGRWEWVGVWCGEVEVSRGVVWEVGVGEWVGVWCREV